MCAAASHKTVFAKTWAGLELAPGLWSADLGSKPIQYVRFCGGKQLAYLLLFFHFVGAGQGPGETALSSSHSDAGKAGSAPGSCPGSDYGQMNDSCGVNELLIL